MSPSLIGFCIVSYFCVLILISYLTTRNSDHLSYYNGNKSSKWYLVAFGMIGASLSGVTFISVPGWVEGQSMSYMQMVLGYIFGYSFIGLVLLPLYYKMNLTSIYTYLDSRFGNKSYKTGSSFFLLSRTIGASFRLFLVANVLQLILFDSFGIPFWATVIVTILLIWIYTFQGGIKTIVWTDSMQTFFMLLAVAICIYIITDRMDISNLFNYIYENKSSKIFFFDDWKAGDYFWKRFLAGIFVAIVMTGLDQDMMQKNLTCRNIVDAQKNMFWFTLVLVVVNFFFLALGILLTDYAFTNGIDAHKDNLFPIIATQGGLGLMAGVFFILGLIAAAYSSADSALTSLTTSFCIDIVEIEKKIEYKNREKTRKAIHIGFSIILIIVILVFKYFIKDKSVISQIFTFANYTYGPLLGLYTFGLFTKYKVVDKAVPFICILSPIFTFIVSYLFNKYLRFDFGFALLIINGLITFLGLYLFRK